MTDYTLYLDTISGKTIRIYDDGIAAIMQQYGDNRTVEELDHASMLLYAQLYLASSGVKMTA